MDLMTCDAKIRPFGDSTELQCNKLGSPGHFEHQAVLHDYAYAGSRTTLAWMDDDRRTFRGEWEPCLKSRGCVLPNDHPRLCAR